MLVSLLYVGIVRFVIRLKYIPVAAGIVASCWFSLSSHCAVIVSKRFTYHARFRMA